jgi:tetratricopeptide (TPR) repeat protein
MKNGLLAIVILLTSVKSIGQLNNIDSLRKVFFSQKNDSNKAKLAYKLSNLYQNQKDSSIYFANKIYEISTELKWENGISSYYFQMSSISKNSGNYPLALELLIKSLKVAEKDKNIKSVAKIYSSIGILYAGLGNYNDALLNYFKAKRLRDSLMIESDASNYSNISDAYLKLNMLDSAIKYQNRAYEIAYLKKDKRWIAISTCNYGNIYSKQLNIEISNSYYKSALNYVYETKDKESLEMGTEIFLGLSNNYYNKGLKDSSIFYAKKAIYYGIGAKYYSSIIEASIKVKEFYKETKVFDSAFKYQEILHYAKDSLFNIKTNQRINAIKTEENYRQQEIERNKVIERINRQNFLQIIGIAIFILILFISLLISSKSRINKKYLRYILTLTILLSFTFISFLISPFLNKVTQDSPVLVIMASIISSLVFSPLQKRFTDYLKLKTIENK